MDTIAHQSPDFPHRDDGPAALAALIATRSLRPAADADADRAPALPGDLPPALDVRAAAALLGISRSTAYTLIHRDEFPCPVFRCGGRYKIPTTHLLDLLGLPIT